MEKILRRDRSPLAENPYPKETPAPPPLENDIQKHLTNFSLISHGFGGPAMVAALTAVKRYLACLKSDMERMVNGGMSLNDCMNVNSSQMGAASNFLLANPHFQTSSYFNTTGALISTSSSSSTPSSSSSTPTSSSSSCSIPLRHSNELLNLKMEQKDC